jgi:hypothetical protein
MTSDFLVMVGLGPDSNFMVTNLNCSILMYRTTIIITAKKLPKSKLLFLSPPAHSLVTMLTALSQLHHGKISTKKLNML